MSNNNQVEKKEQSEVCIDFMLNKHRIVGRDAEALSARYKNAKYKELHFLKILKEKGYIK